MNDSNYHIENSDVIIRYLANEATESEIQMINMWLNESKENKQYFESIKKIYNQQLDKESVNEFDANRAWMDFKLKYAISHKRQETYSEKPLYAKKTKRILLPLARIAAVIVLAFGIWGIYQYNRQKEINITSNKEIVERSLPDGSAISLNKNSTIQYASSFGKRQRKISLTGEAFFKVEKDTLVPFIINTNNVRIEVVGTEFNVNAYPNEEKTEVTVSSGIVKVTYLKADSTIILTKGEKGVFARDNKKIVKTSNNNSNYIAWKTKIYVFEKAKISDVFDILEKDFDVNITVENENFNNCTLFSRFENMPLNDILDIIKYTFNIDYIVNNKNIVIKGKGC